MVRRPTTLSDRNLVVLALSLFVSGMVQATVELPGWVYDLSRAYVLATGIMIFMAALAIVRVYYRNFRIAPAKARLLPRHVVQLGVVLMALVFVVCAVAIDRVDSQPPWYGVPLLMPALTVGVFGLWDMLRWLPDRRKDLRPTGDHGARLPHPMRRHDDP